jgi:hypothetical protein
VRLVGAKGPAAFGGRWPGIVMQLVHRGVIVLQGCAWAAPPRQAPAADAARESGRDAVRVRRQRAGG